MIAPVHLRNVSDEIVENWYFLDNVYVVPVLTVVYVAFAFKLGPKFMENRKPLEIKGLILCHNALQVLINVYIILWVLRAPNIISFLADWNNCSPIEKSNPHYDFFIWAAWCFYLSRLYDLSDTVFFVLRRKQSHVNFLHVYHHAAMLLTSWSYCNYSRAHQIVFFGTLNCFVHTVMYIYYFLSALGPSVQKYLWWKKYVTKLQLLQFGIFIIYSTHLILSNCIQSQGFIYYSLVQATIFAILFGNFYRRTYLKKEQ